MRADAARDGLVFDEVPPYRIRRTATMDEPALRRALFDAEDRLGRRLDETPRPHLVSAEGMPDPPDRFEIDLDREGPDAFERAARPGAQHAALWLCGRDLYRSRGRIVKAVEARIRVDPHARLDVVLAASQAFPLDVLDEIHAVFKSAPQSYLSRSQGLRGEDAQRRVTIVVRQGVLAPPDWIDTARDEVDVFQETTAARAVEVADQLGDALPAALITDASEEWRELLGRADPDQVAFASRALEREWTREAKEEG
jgi:hypothetical protein